MITKETSKGTIRVDAQDGDLLGRATVMNHGYVMWYGPMVKGKRERPLLHRLILERIMGYAIPNGMEVDHIDGDKLNNQRLNLRLCTPRQNQQNTNFRKDNTSGYKGVSWDKKAKKWLSQIKTDEGRKSIGRYKTAEEAQDAYVREAMKHHGRFANDGKGPINLD